MSDDRLDLGDYVPASEKAAESSFAQETPGTANPYGRIDGNLGTDLSARQEYAESAAKEHAKEALENLYGSEFPIDNPPDSYERYEAELTLRHLRSGIVDMLAPEIPREQHIHVDVDGSEVSASAELIEEVTGENVDFSVQQAIIDARVEQAKHRIDVMATYGQLAEPQLAALTYSDIHSEVRAYATEKLSEVREEQNQSKSLTAAIRDWWRGGG